MPRLSVDDNQDPIDAAVDAAIGAQQDDFTSAETSNEEITSTQESGTEYSTGDETGDHGAGQQQQQQQSGAQHPSTQFTQQSDQQRQGNQTSQSNTQQGQQGVGNRQDATQQQQGQQQQQRQFGQRVREDGRGNFVDEKGKMVARAGAERRLYEQARRFENDLINERNTVQKASQAVRQLQTRLQQAEQHVQQIQQNAPKELEAVSQARKSGMQDQEIALGIDIVAQLKANPIQGVRRVLQSAQAQGYNLKDILGEDVQGTSGIDMGAVKQMIDTQLQPITEAQRRQQAEEQRQQEGQQAYQQFVATHPNADVHMSLISDYVSRNPNLSAESAYYEIKMFAAQNGLDFSKPLGPQVAQTRQQQTTQQQQQQQQNMPLPNGAGMNTGFDGGIGGQQPANSNASSGANDDWDSIISTSLRESGMQM